MLGNILPKAKAFARVPGKPPSTDVRDVSSQSDGDSLPGYAPQRHMWSPVILRSVSLAVFGVLFICFIIVIEVLYSVSTQKKGLSTSEERYHYLWTYGPTAGKPSFAYPKFFTWSMLIPQFLLLSPGFGARSSIGRNSLCLGSS